MYIQEVVRYTDLCDAILSTCRALSVDMSHLDLRTGVSTSGTASLVDDLRAGKAVAIGYVRRLIQNAYS